MAGTRQASKSNTKTVMTDAAIKAQHRQGLDHGSRRWTRRARPARPQGDRGVLAARWGRTLVRQMVAVSTSGPRGLRAMNQKCDGEFSVSVTRVMDVALPKLYAAATKNPAGVVPQRRIRGDLAHQGQVLARQMERRPAGGGLLCQRRWAGRRSRFSPTSWRGGDGGKRTRFVEESDRQARNDHPNKIPRCNYSFLPGRPVEAYLARSKAILIPIGSTEQHGPNGLLGTDALCPE